MWSILSVPFEIGGIAGSERSTFDRESGTSLTRATLLMRPFGYLIYSAQRPVSDTFPDSYVLDRTRGTAPGSTSGGEGRLVSLFGTRGVMRMCGTIGVRACLGTLFHFPV